MTNAATGWTVVFRDGAPHDWSRASQAIASGSRFLPADAARAVRQGQGFVDLVMEEAESREVEAALTRVGLASRALRWSECEPAETPTRCKALALDAEEVLPGFPFARVEVVHLVFAQSAPFFLPPTATEAAHTANRVATLVATGVNVLGLEDLGMANAAKSATEVDLASAPASTSAPEWVVEVLGLWAPRVHVPVDAISMPGVQGRRARLAAFLEKLLTRAPAARRVGPVDDALKRVSLDGLRPTQAVDHRRLVMALLTARRLWPR